MQTGSSMICTRVALNSLSSYGLNSTVLQGRLWLHSLFDESDSDQTLMTLYQRQPNLVEYVLYYWYWALFAYKYSKLYIYIYIYIDR